MQKSAGQQSRCDAAGSSHQLGLLLCCKIIRNELADAQGATKTFSIHDWDGQRTLHLGLLGTGFGHA
jgi:hypothetical protein